MASYEIEGELIESFNVAWATPEAKNGSDMGIEETCNAVQDALKERLDGQIKPHEAYGVFVLITKLEKRDG